MFKSGVSSYFIPQMIRKFGAKKDTSRGNRVEEGQVPSSFVMPSEANQNQLINVSMNERDESFVDISCKQMTYAEVASMAKAQSMGMESAVETPSQGVGKTAAGAAVTKSRGNGAVSASSTEAKPLDDEDKLESSEQFAPIKCDISYKKSKQYKHKQFESVQMKKMKQASYKQECVASKEKRGRQYSGKGAESDHTKPRKKDIYSERKMNTSLTLD